MDTACPWVSVSVLSGCGGNNNDEDGAAPPATSEKTGSLAAVPGLYDRLQSSVVAVLVQAEEGAGEGSGVVFERRRIITNNHVVAGGREISVALASGERVPATLLARDRRTDLAVLTVERDLPPARFAERLPPVGSLAVAMGNPLGSEGRSLPASSRASIAQFPSGGTTPALVTMGAGAAIPRVPATRCR